MFLLKIIFNNLFNVFVFKLNIFKKIIIVNINNIKINNQINNKCQTQIQKTHLIFKVK